MKMLVRVIIVFLSAILILAGRGASQSDPSEAGQAVGVLIQLVGVIICLVFLFGWSKTSFSIPNYEKHRASLTTQYALFGVLYLLSAVSVFLLTIKYTEIVRRYLSKYFVGQGSGAILLILTLAAFFIAVGIYKKTDWVRPIAKIFAIPLSLSLWPVGLLVALETWWVLRKPSDTVLELLTTATEDEHGDFSAPQSRRTPNITGKRLANNKPERTPDKHRHYISKKVAVKSDQSDIGALLAANPRAHLVIEYSDKAHEQLTRLSALPTAYIVRYVEALEKNPRIDPVKLAETIFAEHDSEKLPFQRKDLNDAFTEVSSLGESAASEFKRIVEVLGEDVDLVDVVGKLRDKFAKADFRTFPGIVYRGYTIVKLGNGKFIVRNSKGEKPAGTIEYPKERDAKEVIDWLLRDSR